MDAKLVQCSLTSAEWHKIESFHMHCQCHIVNISRYDFVSNTYVGEPTGQPFIYVIAFQHCLQLFGDVASMSGSVLPMPLSIRPVIFMKGLH